MFNRDDLHELAETIIYINLLLAILSVIALYDQRAANDREDDEDEKWQKEVDAKIEELELKIKKLEEALRLKFTNEYE